MKDANKIILQNGIYKKTINTSSAVFVITGMTIGAGILGIPYIVAQVGYWVGLAYIIVLGTIMLFLNLMIGEIVVRTKNSHQLPGLAYKYLGKAGKMIMSLIILFGGLGALLAYIVGEGETLKVLFGGESVWWGVLFWTICSLIVWRGLQTAKFFEKILSLAVISIIIGLSLAFLPSVHIENFTKFTPAKFFLPFGIILFALHASPAIAEAHALMPGSQRHFKRALIIGTVVPVVIYVLFAAAVVGVGGKMTTEIATIGLGEKYGGVVFLLANLFAILAMGTGFVGLGIALKQSLVWDFKVSSFLATILVVFTPLTFYMLGLRQFIVVLDVVGGLFIGIEALLVVLIYWRAKILGDLPAGRFGLYNSWLLAVPVILVFTSAIIISIIKLVKF